MREKAHTRNNVDLPSLNIEEKYFFWITKRFFDAVVSIILLLPLGLVAVALLILNPLLNPGPLFFVQIRMGRHCRSFKLYKFRTMLSERKMQRGPNDPLEHDRVTPLGRFLRNSRTDELPQILNVLLGEMSLLGPRPDYFSHARTFVRIVPNYRLRHEIRPGISGLAQVTHGYAEGVEATHAKVSADLFYIQNVGFKLETVLVWETIKTVIQRTGA